MEATNPVPGTACAVEVDEVGRIVFDKFEDGVRFTILRGPTAWCAYVGIPKDHPLAGFGYDDIGGVDAHGGLTYAGEGVKGHPDGFYWYGWDYAHAGDMNVYDHRPEMKEIRDKYPNRPEDKDWTIDEVIKDSWSALYDFKKIMSLAEKIRGKTK